MSRASRDTPGAYAGIGSRSTPPEELRQMERLAHRLALLGWTLRSGGAPGADQAFMRGARQAGGAVEPFLPWPGFERIEDPRLTRPTGAATELAALHHPAWESCSAAARALHARNCHEVLGASLEDPVSFVVCWTPDGSLDGRGRQSGGTGQALRIAAAFQIPVFNLARPAHRARLDTFLA